MRRIKRMFHSRFLDKPMNIALLITCMVIVGTQLYFILNKCLENVFENLYNFISSNQLFLAIIAGVIPLMPNVFLFLNKKIKEKKETELNVQNEFSPEKTEVFPGAISCEMIKKGDVVLVSERTFENLHEKKPMILDREKQCHDILEYIKLLKKKSEKNKFNCLFLTGTSGSGKSILLNHFLMKELSENGTDKDCLYFNDYNTACDLIYNEIASTKAKIIIMDQFEKSIDYIEIYKYIKALINDAKYALIFIFSFPQDVFDQISLNVKKYVINDGESNSRLWIEKSLTYTHFLGYDEHDIMQLKILINTFLKVGIELVDECLDYLVQAYLYNGNFMSVINLGRFPASLVFMCSILARIKVGKSPLVEFSIVSYIYELYREEIDYNVDKYIDDLSKIFELYLDHWIDKFPNADTGKIILQLLSDGRKYTVDDLKCVTFEPSECFTLTHELEYNDKRKITFNIRKVLSENKFITVQENFFGFKFGVFAVHDFFALKMSEYCFGKLENVLRQNVDYYKKKMVQTEHGYSMQVESKAKSKLLKRYEIFHTKYNQLFINVFIYILMVSSVLISYVKGCKFKYYTDNIFYIFITIGCFFSTYYIYNMIMQFFRMLKKRYYYPMTICGSVLIILCYIFPDFWGVFSGIEIVILGISLYSARKDTVSLAVDFFRGKGLFYIVLGMVVIGFGIEYACVSDSLMLKYTLAVFFIIYVAASNFTHIKYSYIMNKVGMGNTIQ